MRGRAASPVLLPGRGPRPLARAPQAELLPVLLGETVEERQEIRPRELGLHDLRRGVLRRLPGRLRLGLRRLRVRLLRLARPLVALRRLLLARREALRHERRALGVAP